MKWAVEYIYITATDCSEHSNLKKKFLHKEKMTCKWMWHERIRNDWLLSHMIKMQNINDKVPCIWVIEISTWHNNTHKTAPAYLVPGIDLAGAVIKAWVLLTVVCVLAAGCRFSPMLTVRTWVTGPCNSEKTSLSAVLNSVLKEWQLTVPGLLCTWRERSQFRKAKPLSPSEQTAITVTASWSSACTTQSWLK